MATRCDTLRASPAIEGQDLKNFDALVDWADKRLARVLSRRVADAAGALAVIDFVIDDYALLSHSRFGERLETRLLEARNFFASAVDGAA